jgi:uncharacterized protein with HEPN domain
MKNYFLYVEDALAIIDKIELRLKSVKKAEFVSDQDLQDSVVLQIIYLGEALNRTNQTFRDKFPQVAWTVAIGMRHRLAHDYGEVDINVVWDTVRKDLPELKRQLLKVR